MISKALLWRGHRFFGPIHLRVAPSPRADANAAHSGDRCGGFGRPKPRRVYAVGSADFLLLSSCRGPRPGGGHGGLGQLLPCCLLLLLPSTELPRGKAATLSLGTQPGLVLNHLMC